MSNRITLNPSTRRANREAFVKANPWTPGLTLDQIHALVLSGEQALKGNFAFPEVTSKNTKARTTRKGATATKRANTKAKSKATVRKPKAKKEQKPSEFLLWLQATAEERATRKKVNKAQAEWMRSHGIVPSGQAWTACSKGERSVKKLIALNEADGVKTDVKVTAQKSGQPSESTTKVTAISAKVDVTQPARPHRPNGSFMSKEQAEQFHLLVSTGLTEPDARKAAVALA